MLLSRFSLFAFMGLVCANLCSAASFTINKVFTVNGASSDVPYTPLVGDSYWVRVDYTQTGTASVPYNVTLRLADRPIKVAVTDLTPGPKSVSQVWTVPLDGDIDIEADIDPDGFVVKPHGPTKTATFTAVPPSAALEFYDPAKLMAQQTFVYGIQASGKYGFDWLEGCPITDGWQTSLTNSCSVNGKNISLVKMPMPTLFPLFYYGGANLTSKELKFVETSTVEVRNQRVNPTKLRQVSWNDMGALQGIEVFKYFEQPEAVVQSNDPVIKSFVENALGGSNYKSKYNPYDACRKIFQTVLAHSMYFYPKAGQLDLRAQNAVQMAQTGIGDCGSFSMLLVACYRQMGIPARTACGGWIGTGVGHCWCEMWFPQAGWVVSDGAMGRISVTSSPGKYAYYFGYEPDLNERYACMRGNTFSYDNASSTWLQGAMYPPITTNCSMTYLSGVGVVSQITSISGMAVFNPEIVKLHAKLTPWNVHDLQRLNHLFLK